jgi:putative transposase
VVGNVLNREFAPEAPNSVWVAEITYIRTYEGWLFLAAVMDLYSRQIVGWVGKSGNRWRR